MSIFQRVLLPMINAFVITAALLYAMFLLIESEPATLTEHTPYRALDFIHVPKDETLVTNTPKPVKPEPVTEQPEITRQSPKFEAETETSIGLPDTTPVIEVDGPISFTNGQLTLVFGYPPIYPRNAINREIEGYVHVGFSVNTAGEVYDEHIVDAQPKGIFDKSALKAIVKFRYKPRYENDRPVSTSGQSYIFSFELEDDQ